MPFAQVFLVEGHTREQKRAVIEKVTQAVQDAIAAPRPNVRVWIHDVPTMNFGVGGVCLDELGETDFPFVQMFIMEGRTEDQKRALVEQVTQALQDAVGAPRAKLRVWITEVPKTNWSIGGVTAKDLGR